MKRIPLPAVACALVLLTGCSSGYGGKSPAADGGAAAPAAIASAAAAMEPTQGNSARGIVTFTEMKDGTVVVVAEMEGLTPGEHAMHVHEKGDCSAPDGTSAGGHYNPEQHAHALPPNAPRHAGDLGNLTADAQGRAHYTITVDNITVKGAKNPVEGRAVIVHAQPDDGGQPVGNAGGRVACGVIVAR